MRPGIDRHIQWCEPGRAGPSVAGEPGVYFSYLGLCSAMNTVGDPVDCRPGQFTPARRETVAPEEAGRRLDNFLAGRLKGVPRGHLYKLCRRGEVRVNSGRAKPDQRLHGGDVVRIPPVTLAPQRSVARDAGGMAARVESWVCYESRELLAVDKPAGSAVHGGSGVAVGVIEALRTARPAAPYLELAHRLDRETSGLLLIAKRRSMLRHLHAVLRDGGMQKRYTALLCGRLPEARVVVDAPLKKSVLTGGERLVRVDPQGKPSRTVFSVTRRFKAPPDAVSADIPSVLELTLAEALLETGRTHQIRVHAKHAGLPLVGDPKYGDAVAERRLRSLGLRRLFLHARQLRFKLPDGAWLDLRAPLPEALGNVLTRLPAVRP